MHCTRLSALAAATIGLAFLATGAQAQEETRAVAGGGISVPGWMGMADEGAVTDARLAPEGEGMHVTTGPAIMYWNPANTASGNYTVSATFTESEYMNLNDHPHPYGIVIAGNDLGTAQKSYLYCAAYGNGTFIVRGFGPDAFALNGRRSEANAAVHTAAGPGQAVTQQIAIAVTATEVTCAINGTIVARYPKTELVAAGRLKSTDGMYGVRFGHNTEAIVTSLTVTRQ